jgi:Tol biopolymer transport system component
MFFTRRLRGVRQILVRDLATNRDSMVVESDDNKFWPIASPSGDRAVYEVRRETDSSIWLVSREGGSPRKLCSGCSHPTSWFGEQAVFYTTAAGEIALLDMERNTSHVVLSPSPSVVLGGADWNAATQFLLFTAGKPGGKKQVFAVRYPAALSSLHPASWIPLTRDSYEVDQPHWSTDGASFYYLSNRDASRCLWGQPFLAQTGRSSVPFPVMHYHDLRFSPDRASSVLRGLTVGGGSVYLTVGEVTDTLWLGSLPQRTLFSLVHLLPFQG